MLKKKLIFIVIFISLIWVTGASAEIKDGLWEITTRVEMKGMPAQLPSHSVKQCITKNNPVPQSAAKGYECKTKHYEVSGNTVTYMVECTGKNSAMLTLGETIYKGNSFNGTSTTTVKNFGQPDM